MKNVNLRGSGLLLAAVLMSLQLSAHARPGGDHEGPPMGKPGGGPGNGNGGSPPGHPPGSPPGHSGDVKVHPPQGVCSADDAAPIDVQGPAGQSGASHVAHTDFTRIDPTTGDPVASDASATMMYFWYGSTFDYVLNAHGLAAGGQWTLAYQPEPLPSPGVLCLGSATVNGGGQLHLANSLELNSNLPPDFDPTGDPAAQPPDALLALVPSADVDCENAMNTTFEPDAALWTNPRVRYVDTDLLPAVQ